MTPTERLREYLDEIGVKWKRVRGHKSNGTSWYDKYGCYVEAIQEYAWDGGEFPEGKMVVRRGPAYMTPKQAIAATLGAGTCHIKPWEMECDTGFYDCMQCDCGMVADVSDWAEWCFCPNCGRKVVDE